MSQVWMSSVDSLANFITTELTATIGRGWYPDLNFIFELGSYNKIIRRLGVNRESSLHHWFVKQKNMNVEKVLGRSNVKHKVRKDSKGVEGINNGVRK